MLLKSPSSDEILDTWYHSAKWHSKASSFVIDKLHEDDKDSMMDIDEGSLKRKTDEDFQWTAASAAELQAALTDKMIVDKKLLKSVNDKAKYIKALKESLHEFLTDKHDIKKLREYAKSLRECENIDFNTEIEKTEEKIRLIQDVSGVV